MLDRIERERINAQVSQSIRELCKERGITQKRLTEMSGVSKTCVNRICNHQEGAQPSFDSIFRVSEALDASIYELMGTDRVSPPHWLANGWWKIKQSEYKAAALHTIVDSLAE